MDDYPRMERKRLSCDLPKKVYMAIRMISGEKECTITKIVIRALIEYIKKEEKQNI